MITFLVFLIILSALVLIHEAGHYLVAKKLGIKVEEFGWGIPPRLWGKKIGETIYSINWLPVGGFVKLFGEDDAGGGRVVSKKDKKTKDHGDLKRAFYARPVWQRAAVVVAGVVMNAFLAFLIFYVYLAWSGFSTKIPLLYERQFFFVNQENRLDSLIIRDIQKDSPASSVGLKPCSKEYCAQITAFNNRPITTSEEFTSSIKDSAGKEVSLSITDLASKKTSKTTLVPRPNPPEGEGALGIRFEAKQVAVVSYDTLSQRIFSGVIHPLNLMLYQFDILGRLIAVSFQERTVEPVGSAFSGPVGIFVVTGDLLSIPDFKERMLNLLNLAGLLSMSLAIFNILPIPALDGGRLSFILFEGITGRKVNQRVEAMIHTVGMAVLLFLILLVSFKDIFQYIIN